MDQDGITNNPAPAQPSGSPVPAPADGLPPFPIPDHHLLRCIGRGSYGEVWLARNVMNLYRAVKIVRRQSFDSARPFERELSGIRKFEPVSRSHDGFVDILHIGNNETRDSFYYVMELGDDRVAGQEIDPEHYAPKTLAHEISRRGKLPLQECLQLGLALSKALAELHKHGLVHRDIKPSNIIFVLGIPKLADIGLVADVGEARSYVGTDGFIPPEGPGSRQADIYSLGKVLYEASTGKDRQDFPELPTWWDKSPDHEGLLELNEAILKACANDPTRRYQTALDLHADLVLLSNGKSLRRLKVLERRFSNLKRVARVSLLVLAALAALAFQGYREWNNVVESRKRQVADMVRYGNEAQDSGNLLEAFRFYADAFRLDQGNRSSEFAQRLRFGCVRGQSPKLTHLWIADGQVDDAQFSPDGSKVLIAEAYGQVKIYDLQDYRASPRALGSGGFSSVTYSPDGRWILAAGHDSTASLWDSANLTNIRSIQHTGWVYSARFSPDGTRLVTACGDGVARVWDPRTGQPTLEIERQAKAVLFAAFSPDGKWIVTTGQDGNAAIWDAQDGRSVLSRRKHPNWVMHAAFSEDGKKLATACEDYIARVWETGNGGRIRPDLHHRDMLTCVEFSPDGRVLLTAALDGIVRLWRADDLEPVSLNPILAHCDRVVSAAFDPAGHRIVAACADGSVRVWDMAWSVTAPSPLNRSFSRSGNRFFTVTNQAAGVFDALTGAAVGPALKSGAAVQKGQLSRDGQFVLTIPTVQATGFITNRLAQVWSASTGEAMGPGLTISSSLMGVALGDDGKRLAIYDGATAQIWDVLSGKQLFSPPAPMKHVSGTVFSPEGRRVATWGGNKVEVWDAVTGKLAFSPVEFPALVQSVEFSPDGSYLVAGCADNQFTKCFAQVWNAATGKTVGPPLWHGDGVLCTSFSPDGKRLLTGGEDSTAMIREVGTGKQLVSPMRHPKPVTSVAFSPDGKWVVTICADRAARVWNAATGDPVTPPLRHLATLIRATFLPDNRRIVTADADGHAWVWDLPLDNTPVADLALLAHFLSGDTVTPEGVSPEQQLASLQALWQRLRASYPTAFTVSTEQIVAWHEFQARESELAENWFAAKFHWQQLLTLRPGDQAFAEHLKHAQDRLQAER